MTIEYTVELKDRNGNVVIVLPSKKLHSFTYSKFLRTGGSIEVRMHDVTSFIDNLQLPESLDYMWTVSRRDSRFQSVQEVDAVGLHRGVQHLQLNAGNWLNYSYAISFNDLISSETTDRTNDTQSGLISDVANNYASDLLSQFPSISIGAIVGTPSTTMWSGSRRYFTLTKILNELADIDKANYRINEQLEFQWLYPIDNNITVYNNIGQISNLQIVDNYIGIVTHATALGKGIDEDRLSVTEYGDYYNNYGEFYYNHTVRTANSESISELAENAKSIITDSYNNIVDVKFTITNHPSFLYKRDFDVGHILRVEFFGRVLKVMVHYVFITLQKTGEEKIVVGCRYYAD